MSLPPPSPAPPRARARSHAHVAGALAVLALAAAAVPARAAPPVGGTAGGEPDAPSGGWTALGLALAGTGIGLRVGVAYAYRGGNLSCVDPLFSFCFWAGVAALPLPLLGSGLAGYDAYRWGVGRGARAPALPAAAPAPPISRRVRVAALVLTGAALLAETAAIIWTAWEAAGCGPSAIRASPDCLGDTLVTAALVQAAAELAIVVAVPTALYTLGYERGLPRQRLTLLPLPLALPAGAGLALGGRF